MPGPTCHSYQESGASTLFLGTLPAADPLKMRASRQVHFHNLARISHGLHLSL